MQSNSICGAKCSADAFKANVIPTALVTRESSPTAGNKDLAVGIFAILTALSTLFFWGVVPTLPELNLTVSGGSAQGQNTLDTIVTTVYQILTDGYWFVDIILGGFWVAAIGAATGEISEQMEYSSMMR